VQISIENSVPTFKSDNTSDVNLVNNHTIAQ
jgi:hypothetical protein